MNILVTGGAGFIGSNFVRHMLKKEKKESITVLDSLTYASNPGAIKEFSKNKKFKFVKGDIRDARKVSSLMKRADVVVNFAAETHVDRSIMGPEIFTLTNVAGTTALLEAARKHGVKKFIQISTDEVYGSIKKGKAKENDGLNPTSPYSSSKASADLIALSYYKTFGLPVVVTRSSNNFGPYQHPEKFIPLFITNALENKKVPLYGSGRNIRNWIYVEDNCEALRLVIKKGRFGNVYNIGGRTEKKNIDIARIILSLAGADKGLLKKVKDRPAHDFRYALSSAKIIKLGWKPKYSFKQAMGATIKWYAENRAWWKKMKNREFSDYYRKWYGKK